MRQWLRKVRVTFQGQAEGFVVNPDDEVTSAELRVAFHVAKGISGSPNTVDLRLWNLTQDHRNAVGKELDLITIEAGYMPPEGGGNVGIIFKGRLRDVQHDREGPDIITTLSCGDGDKAYRNATISKTIERGALISDVIDAIQAEMEPHGIDRGEIELPEDQRTLKRPYSMCGSCTRELDTLGRGNGFYWSIQNETLEVIPADGTLPGMVVIGPETGMISTPTITDNGIKVKTLLNPEIRPNRQIQVVSEFIEMNSHADTYRVSQADFIGDNQQGDFVVDVHGEAMTDGKVDEGKKA